MFPNGGEGRCVGSPLCTDPQSFVLKGLKITAQTPYFQSTVC